jgi:hypothetical protein
MNRNIAATILFAAMSLMTPALHAAPSIVVGHLYLPTTGVTTFYVPYDPSSGGGLMQGQTLYVSIADEGNGQADPADYGEPKIVSIDTVTGTNWQFHVAPPTVSYSTDQFWLIDQVTNTGTVSASGLAFSITIDPNGATVGSAFSLRAVSVDLPNLGGPYFSEWFASPPTAFEGSNGTVEGVLVPEPSSIALAAFALIALTAAACRKRRNI